MKLVFLTSDNREPFKEYNRPLPGFGPAPDALLQGLMALPQEVEVHVVSCLQKPAPFPEKIADNVWFHGAHVPKIGWLKTGYFGCVRASRKIIQKIKPDIVHGQGTERDCAISAVFAGFPNVITIHGNMNAIAKLHHCRIGSFHWLQARIEDFTLPRTQGIICISDYVAGLVRKYGVKTWPVPNAIHQMFFDLPKLETAPLKKPLLINVGVVSERKRQQELLKVLESLRAEGLDFDTLFVGVVPELPYPVEFMKQLAETNRRHGGFQHIGKIDQESFCRLFDRASAMIHFSSEESFGLTFAEAIARGLYLFASDVGAVRDIARGVEPVQIFDLNDWAGLKNNLRQWLVSGAWKQPRTISLPQQFVECYQPVHVARRHLEIYRSVIAGQTR